jgi:hypothetical protein
LTTDLRKALFTQVAFQSVLDKRAEPDREPDPSCADLFERIVRWRGSRRVDDKLWWRVAAQQ